MSEDWKAGDVAVCVDSDGCPDGCIEAGEDGTSGKVYRVTGVLRNPLWVNPALILDGDPGPTGSWCACSFRKLNDEPDDIALIERIKRCQPARQPERVQS